MKRLLGKAIVLSGVSVLVFMLGIAIGFVKEANSNDDVQAVQCEVSEASGYVYEEIMPQYLDACCIAELEEIVFDLYLEDCTNYCAECDLYYYDDCVCWNDECGSDCELCLEFDYMMYIEDNQEMIQEIADEMLIGIQEDYMNRETELVYCEF